MARKATHPPLSVFLNGALVGTLRRAATGAVSFHYAQAWLNDSQALLVSLSLPLRESRYVGAQVMAVFDNLLPDNDAIRRRVAERVGATGTDAFSLLSAIGRDCVGAVGQSGGGPAGGVSDDGAFRISLAGAQEKTALLWHRGAMATADMKPRKTLPPMALARCITGMSG